MKINPITGIVLLLLFFIFIFFRYRDVIIVFIIKHIYGEYSKQYLLIYRKLYGILPFSGGIGSDIIKYLGVFIIQKDLAKKKEPVNNLQFTSINYNCSLKQLMKQKGKPRYFNGKRHGNYTLILAGYDKLVYNIKIKEFYYFLNDKYVLSEYCFNYYHLNLSYAFFDLFNKMIHLENSEKCKDTLFYRNNENGLTQLYEDNGFSISVKYFTNDSINLISDVVQ